MSEWDFPEKQQTFHPEGTMFEKVFEDQIALIAYAQYRRKHIVSGQENEWLPHFALTFSELVKEKGRKTVSLDEVVKIWTRLWCGNPRGVASDEGEEKFRKMLKPILPYIRGCLRLELQNGHPDARSGGTWYLVTKVGELPDACVS